MRKQTTSLGAKFSRILCLLAIALSVFASPAFASASGTSEFAEAGHAMANHDMMHSHHIDLSVSETVESCRVEITTACDLSSAHEHMGGACCAGHCLDALPAFNVSATTTSDARAFMSELISVLPSGEWVNPHRPPNR